MNGSGWRTIGALAITTAAGCVLPEYETLGQSPYATGGAATGGYAPATGGVATGGGQTVGGTRPTGGRAATGGTRATGGDPATGGAKATGGDPATGGAETTGGDPATGGDPSAGGDSATGGDPSAGGALPINYIDDGTIHGYCYGLHAVNQVETDCDTAAGLCCPYSLPGTSWSDFALLGCNVNQPLAGGVGSEGVWTPDLTRGICVRGTGFERVQLQGPNIEDENDRWCANVPAGGGCVDFVDFNSACWDQTGNDYMGEPLQAVQAIQPSLSDGVEVARNPISGELCVTEVYVR